MLLVSSLCAQINIMFVDRWQSWHLGQLLVHCLEWSANFFLISVKSGSNQKDSDFSCVSLGSQTLICVHVWSELNSNVMQLLFVKARNTSNNQSIQLSNALIPCITMMARIQISQANNFDISWIRTHDLPTQFFFSMLHLPYRLESLLACTVKPQVVAGSLGTWYHLQ